MKKPAPKPAKKPAPAAKKQAPAPQKKQPAQPKGKQHHHVHHLTQAQLKQRQQTRIKNLQHQLHLARHPAPPAKKTHKARKPRALSAGTPCVAAALAAALGLPEEALTPFCPDEPGGADIGQVLANVAGMLPVTFWPCDPQDATAGTVLGLALPEGMHAAVYAGGGLMWSWGQLMPVYGAVEEAWAVA